MKRGHPPDRNRNAKRRRRKNSFARRLEGGQEHPDALGPIDELNSQIGFARSLITDDGGMDESRSVLVLVQQ